MRHRRLQELFPYVLIAPAPLIEHYGCVCVVLCVCARVDVCVCVYIDILRVISTIFRDILSFLTVVMETKQDYFCLLHLYVEETSTCHNCCFVVIFQQNMGFLTKKPELRFGAGWGDNFPNKPNNLKVSTLSAN